MRNRQIYIIVKNHVENNNLTREQVDNLTAANMSLNAAQVKEWRLWRTSILRNLAKYFDEQEFAADVEFVATQLDGGPHNRRAVRDKFGGVSTEQIIRDGRKGTIVWHDGGAE